MEYSVPDVICVSHSVERRPAIRNGESSMNGLPPVGTRSVKKKRPARVQIAVPEDRSYYTNSNGLGAVEMNGDSEFGDYETDNGLRGGLSSENGDYATVIDCRRALYETFPVYSSQLRSMQLDNHLRPHIFNNTQQTYHQLPNSQIRVYPSIHQNGFETTNLSNENLKVDGSSGYGSHSSQEPVPEPRRRSSIAQQDTINKPASEYYWMPDYGSPRVRPRKLITKPSTKPYKADQIYSTVNPMLIKSEPRLNHISCKYTETQRLLKNGVDINKSSMEELNFWRKLSDQSQQEENTMRRLKARVSLKSLPLVIKCSDRDPIELVISSEDTTLDILKRILDDHHREITMRTALVQRYPSRKIERIFEDDEMPFQSISARDLKSGELQIVLEDRNDTYGIFQNARTWLRHSFCNPQNSMMSKTAVQDIFGTQKWGESINFPEHKDRLYIRTHGGRWKKRYCTIRASGIYAGRHSYSRADELTRVCSFSKMLHLFTSTGRWTNLLAPTTCGFVLNIASNLIWNPDAALSFCTLDCHSLNSWYGFIRIALNGRRIWNNYKERLRMCHFLTNEEEIFSMAQAVHEEPQRSREQENDSLWTDRKRYLLNKHLSTSSTTITTGSIFAAPNRSRQNTPDSMRSFADFEIGSRVRPPSRSHSLNSWQSSLRSRSGSLSRSIGDFFANIVEKSNVKIAQPVKRRLSRGPSARRCSRSIRCISAPYAVVSTNPMVPSGETSSACSPFPDQDDVSFPMPPPEMIDDSAAVAARTLQ
ncbi:Ras-associated and pleckstrin y domains-containing protein 1, partial [Cichlidogyrus casuarinus]